MCSENDCTYKKKYSIVHAKKDISLRYQFFSLRQKNQQIFSADFNDAGKGTWTLMTAIVTRTWTVRVCQFRHSCVLNCLLHRWCKMQEKGLEPSWLQESPIPPFLHIKLLCCPAADKAYDTTTAFKCQHFFSNAYFLYFFEKLLTLCLTFGIISSCRKH